MTPFTSETRVNSSVTENSKKVIFADGFQIEEKEQIQDLNTRDLALKTKSKVIQNQNDQNRIKINSQKGNAIAARGPWHGPTPVNDRNSHHITRSPNQNQIKSKSQVRVKIKSKSNQNRYVCMLN